MFGVLLTVYIGLWIIACPVDQSTPPFYHAGTSRQYALEMLSGDVLLDSVLQTSNCGPFVGGIYAPNGNVRIINNTIRGFGTGT